MHFLVVFVICIEEDNMKNILPYYFSSEIIDIYTLIDCLQIGNKSYRKYRN